MPVCTKVASWYTETMRNIGDYISFNNKPKVSERHFLAVPGTKVFFVKFIESVTPLDVQVA